MDDIAQRVMRVEREETQGRARMEYLARVGNSQAAALSVLCKGPPDVKDVLVMMLAGLLVETGLSLPNVQAEIAKHYAEQKRIEDTRSQLQQGHVLKGH